MTHRMRLSLAATAALAALAFAGSAFASFTPKLVVSSAGGAGGETRIGVVVGATDDPTAVTSIYVPAGYTVGTPTPGTKLGTVTATAAAADLGNTVLPLTGDLDAIAPTATTQADAQACGVSPTQTWDLHLEAAGQTLDIPLFVVTPLAPVVSAGYSSLLVVCLPPPDVPVGTPGRAVFGAKLLSATFSVSAITAPAAAGSYRWTSLWTPYTPNTGQANPAGTVEVQSIRHLPGALTLKVTKKKAAVKKTPKLRGKPGKPVSALLGTKVTFASKATEGGAAPANVAITTTAAGKKVGGAAGSFTFTGAAVTVVSTARLDSDSGSVPTGVTPTAADLWFHDLGSGGCTATPIFQGLPCLDATVGGSTIVAKTVVRKA